MSRLVGRYRARRNAALHRAAIEQAVAANPSRALRLELTATAALHRRVEQGLLIEEARWS